MYFVAKPNEEAKAFIQAAGLTDETQMKAIGTLVFDLKNYGIWDKMKAIYPFVGQPGVSSSFQFNLKDPTTFKGIFSGSWTYESTGITGDGITAYMDTNYNPSSNSSLNNGSIGAYVNNGTTGYAIMGAVTTTTGTSATQLIPVDSGTTMYGDIHDASVSGTPNTTKNAFFQASRINSTQKSHAVNTTITTINDTSTSLTNLNIWIGARNVNGSYNQGYSSRIAFAYIGDGLSTTEMTNYYTAVQRFQTTLGRQV